MTRACAGPSVAATGTVSGRRNTLSRMPAPSVPLLLVLDGNSLIHRAYHAAPLGRLADRDGRPMWALHGLVGYVARAAARLRPDAVLVGFDCPDHSARKVD